MAVKQMVFVDLVLDTGDLVRIECPTEHEDELYDTLDNNMRRGACWSCMMFEGCNMEFLGQHMDRVSMKRVVGML